MTILQYEPRHEKTGFCAYAKTKTQISFAVTTKLISAFVFATGIVQSLYYLHPKFQASSHLLCLPSPVCVGPGWKHRRPVFSQRGSYCLPLQNWSLCFSLQFVWWILIEVNQYMSRVVRKLAFCICENKDADQLRGNREADQRLCFNYSNSTIPLLPKSEISRL